MIIIIKTNNIGHKIKLVTTIIHSLLQAGKLIIASYLIFLC